MELELAGKRALITGSSRGIGKAIAQVLHAEGCRLVLNARNEPALAAAVAALPASTGIAGDMGNAADVKRVVDQAIATLGGLDLLVCNVGGGKSVPPGKETPEEWQRVFALNLWSAVNTVEAARPALSASRGAIVCISSICGLEVVPGAPVTYSAAKAALHAFVRGIARPLGQAGVRINAIAPGNIMFEGSVWERKLAEDAAAVQTLLSRDVSLSRLGTPQEVAELTAWLASSRSAFATGAVWALDGGQIRS